MRRHWCGWDKLWVRRRSERCMTGWWRLRSSGRPCRGERCGWIRPVVESNIHYPTDSGLLADGGRVLTRTMKKIEQKTGGLKKKIRDRKRSVAKRVITIGHALRHKWPEGEEKRKAEYRELLQITRRILSDAGGVMQEVELLPRGGAGQACEAYASSWKLWRIEFAPCSGRRRRGFSEG